VNATAGTTATFSAVDNPTNEVVEVGEPKTGLSDVITAPNIFSPQQIKELKTQQRHLMHVMKKRDQRWASPYADAKMEDIKFCLERLDQVLYQVEIVRKALVKADILKKEDFEAVIERDKQRFAKAKELQEDTTMSIEEKKAIAIDFEIPLEVLGIVENPPQENV
jgi:hypothetical protein